MLSFLLEWFRGLMGDDEVICKYGYVANTQCHDNDCTNIRVGVIDGYGRDDRRNNKSNDTNDAVERRCALCDVSFEQVLVFTIKQCNSFFCRDVEMAELFVFTRKGLAYYKYHRRDDQSVKLGSTVVLARNFINAIIFFN